MAMQSSSQSLGISVGLKMAVLRAMGTLTSIKSAVVLPQPFLSAKLDKTCRKPDIKPLSLLVAVHDTCCTVENFLLDFKEGIVSLQLIRCFPILTPPKKTQNTWWYIYISFSWFPPHLVLISSVLRSKRAAARNNTDAAANLPVMMLNNKGVTPQWW